MIDKIDVPTTPCGSECTRYLVEGLYGCRECMAEFEENERQAETERNREYEVYVYD